MNCGLLDTRDTPKANAQMQPFPPPYLPDSFPRRQKASRESSLTQGREQEKRCLQINSAAIEYLQSVGQGAGH